MVEKIKLEKVIEILKSTKGVGRVTIENFIETYKNFDDMFVISKLKNIEDEVDKLFHYYREKGYPDYKKSNYNKQEVLRKIREYNEDNILNGEELAQTMHGLGFLWTYFPHWKEIKCGGADNTLIENWNNDEKLKKLIKKTYKWQIKHGNGRWTENRIRQNSKVYLNKQTVSNFRPTVAKYIYNNYGNKGKVWDMSCGFGGRLLGFLASNCQKYIGTEPSKKTYKGLNELRNDFDYVNKEVELYKIGSEEFFVKEDIDLAFTSPPYFDTEKYSNEKTQSYIKYPTKDEWVNGFLKKTIDNVYQSLKVGGYFIINISKEFEESVINLSNKFTLEDRLKLVLSSISGKGKKYEPVLVFRKV